MNRRVFRKKTEYPINIAACLKILSVVIIVLGSLAFFEPVILDRQMIGMIHLVTTGLIAALLLIYSVYDTSKKMKANFTS